MFRLDQSAYRRTTQGSWLVDHLPWGMLEARGVMRLKSGALQRTLKFRPQDASVASPHVQVAIHERLHQALARLPHGTTLFLESRRAPAHIPTPEYTTRVTCARLVEYIRHYNISELGQAWHTEHYLTIFFQPGSTSSSKLLDRLKALFGPLFEGGEEVDRERDELDARMHEELDRFVRDTNAFARDIAPNFASLHWLGDAELLTYLHATVSTQDHPILVPDPPMCLDAILADEPVEVGLEGKIGAEHMSVISVRGYPDQTSPNMLDALSGLPWPFRLVHRYKTLGPEQTTHALKTFEVMYRSQVKRVNPLIEKGSEYEIDRVAARSARDVESMTDLVRRGYHLFGEHTTTLVVRAATTSGLDERVEQAMALLRQSGFACTREASNLRQAWLSSLPGLVLPNPRRALISTRNFRHMIPTRGIWQGSQRNAALDLPALMTCWSSNQEPFFLNLVPRGSDVGHTTVLGPSGAGKSVLLGSLVLAFRRYSDAQVYIFDKKRSAKILTLACEGVHLELGIGQAQVGFQPLRRIDDPVEFAFVLSWLEQLVIMCEGEIDKGQRAALKGALESVSTLPVDMRTLSSLRLQVQDTNLREVLEPYTDERGLGKLFDCDRESLELSDMVCFEFDDLLAMTKNSTRAGSGNKAHSSEQAVALTLSYLFHRLKARFTGRPTLLVLDEAWQYLKIPAFAAQIAEWLKELRKLGAYVVLASQNVDDFLLSSIGSTIAQEAMTKIYLPNLAAMGETVAQGYRRADLTTSQIQFIATATPKRDYYMVQGRDARAFQLGLSELELALVASASKEHQALIPDVQRQAREQGRSFLSCYLERSGFKAYTDQLDKGETR